jgi:membrane protein
VRENATGEPATMASTSQTDEVRRGAGASPVAKVRGTAARLTASLASTHHALRRQQRWYALLAEMVAEARAHKPDMLAKQAAYSLLYAVPSILIMLISLAAIVDRNTGAGVSTSLQRMISEQAPADIQPLLDSLVQYAIAETSESAAITAVIISLAIAIWGGSAGVGALIYAINEVYDIRDTRSFVKSTALRLGLMVLDGIIVIGALILLTFGHQLGTWLVMKVGYGSRFVDFLLSGPIWGFVLLIVALVILYWFAPDIAKSFRWVAPGAVAAAVAISLLLALLQLVLSYTNPGTAYGAAGGVLVLLWSLFLVSQIVIIGAIVNAVLSRHFDRKKISALRKHPEKRLDHGEIVVSVYR